MTPLRVYSRDFLLTVEKAVSREWLNVPSSVIKTLRDNNICSIPRTHRGVSAGKFKQRSTVQPIKTPQGPTNSTATNRKLRQRTIQPVITTNTPTHVRAGQGGVNWGNITSISTTKSTSGSGLTIGSLNVQSARNKSDVICDIVTEHDIDILTLTETWLTFQDKDDLHVKGLTLPGYEFLHVPRKGNGGYGGVGILHKANIKIINKEVYEANSFENLQIKFNTGSRCLDLVTMYRPPLKQQTSSPTPCSSRNSHHSYRTKSPVLVIYCLWGISISTWTRKRIPILGSFSIYWIPIISCSMSTSQPKCTAIHWMSS